MHKDESYSYVEINMSKYYPSLDTLYNTMQTYKLEPINSCMSDMPNDTVVLSICW